MFNPLFRMVLTLALCLNAALSLRAEDVDGVTLREDPRLQHPVTISAPRIYLGELMEQISHQTGIKITVDDDDAASGTELAVDCRNVPVGTMMHALRSLVSTRDNPWRWTRTISSQAYIYQLIEPASAKLKSEHMRAFCQRTFENYSALMFKLCFLNQEEREHHKQELSAVLMQNDDKYAEALIRTQGTWDIVRLFALAVPPDIRSAVLRGERSINVPITDLSGDARDLLDALHDGLNPKRVINGVVQNKANMTSIKFYCKPASPEQDFIPVVWVDLGQGGGSFSLLGGAAFEDAIRNAVKNAWLLAEDKADDPKASNLVVQADTEPMPQDIDRGRVSEGFDLRVLQLARGTHIPLVALLARDASSNPGSPVGNTVHNYLRKTRFEPSLPMYKWNHDMLLINHAIWFLRDERAIPYGIVKNYLRVKGGLISVSSLAKLISALEGQDATELAQTYPAIAAALQIRPVFALYKYHPSLLAPEGMPLHVNDIDMLRSLPFHKPVDERSLAVRLTQQEQSTSDSKYITIRIEILGPDHKWKLLGGFTQSATYRK